MKALRWLLLPFSWLYGFAIWLRNRLYDWGWIAHSEGAIPTIVVGNLAVGGTGKTPMVEHLIRVFLQENVRVATLSRGYGRKTKGFLEVFVDSEALDTGDEPLQFKKKFPEITVSVCEDRVLGVRKLQMAHDLIILDDAYQHRALKPGLSVLLFDYNHFSKPYFLLPAGDFRDHFSERRRADLMVVTKSPQNLSSENKEKIRRQLHVPSKEIPTFFSHIGYEELVWISQPEKIKACPPSMFELDDTAVLLVTGIANPVPLVDFLKPNVMLLKHKSYKDHHAFSAEDMQQIHQEYHQMEAPKRIILTTEKDATRLLSLFPQRMKELPWAYLPIKAKFNTQDQALLEDTVLDCYRNYRIKNQ